MAAAAPPPRSPTTRDEDAGRGEEAPRRLTRVPALEGLRGVAVGLVLAYHVQTFLLPGAVDFEAPGPLPGGFLGVDVFFVLSGFLITALLLNEQDQRGRIGLGSFYRRRALRLIPALYILLLAHAIYARATGLSLRLEWLTGRAAATYLSNWTWKWDGLEGAPGLGHLWSLAIEGQFYLVWPVVVLGLLGLGRSSRTVTVVLVAAIAIVAVHRLVLLERGANTFFLYLRTDTRIDSLLVGALLAQLWVRRLTPRRGLGAAATAAAVLLTVAVTRLPSTEEVLYRGGFTLVAVASAIVILAAIEGPWVGQRVLEVRLLRGVGAISYELYLCHLPIFDVVNRYGATWSPWRRVAVGLPLSLAASVLLWGVVRSLLTALRRRPAIRSPILRPGR